MLSTKHKPKSIWINLGLIALLARGLLWRLDTAPATAQTIVTWSRPILLSSSNVEAWSPTIVADPEGNVHVMWSQTMTNPPPPGEGDTLFYTRWDGEQWTRTVDVLVSPEGAASAPELAVTPDGMLHAVWHTGGKTAKLMYARAPACCAEDAKNWSLPRSLGSSVLNTIALVADEQGRLHAAFASNDTEGIVYLRSDDGGNSWPVWTDIISSIGLDELASAPRLAVDGRGRVHIVWTVMPWPGHAVVYIRSDDGGHAWNEPVIVDTALRKEYREGYGPIDIDIEAIGQDEIHMIWDGAPTVERTHIWSRDGGKTWSPMNLVFPSVTVAGRGSWNDMAVDSAGILHAVSLQPNGSALHSTWDGTTWSTPDKIPTNDSGELFRIAISRGNVIHVVWSDKKARPYTVWHVSGQLAAPELTARLLSTPAKILPTPTVTLARASETAPLQRPTLEQDKPATSAPTPALNPAYATVMGIISVIVILGIVALVSLGLSRRN